MLQVQNTKLTKFQLNYAEQKKAPYLATLNARLTTQTLKLYTKTA